MKGGFRVWCCCAGPTDQALYSDNRMALTGVEIRVKVRSLGWRLQSGEDFGFYVLVQSSQLRLAECRGGLECLGVQDPTRSHPDLRTCKRHTVSDSGMSCSRIAGPGPVDTSVGRREGERERERERQRERERASERAKEGGR